MFRLLKRLEVSPSSVLAEEDLLQDAAEDFENWRGLGLLRLVDEPPGSFRYMVQNTAYIVKRDGDDFIAFEADEQEPEVIRLSESQVRSWTADIPAIVRLMQRENGLTGTPEKLTSRLWLLGQREDKAFVLGLFDEATRVEFETMILPERLPRDLQSFVLVLPSLALPASFRRRLEDRRIEIARLDHAAHFQIAMRPNPEGLALSEQGAGARDDSTAILNGETFSLSPRWAKLVRILAAAKRTGQPDLSWMTIKVRLEAGEPKFYVQRIQDILKSSKKNSRLIERTARGRWRLVPGVQIHP
jgi:hypothetical protein